jgi:hypothetical protein
MTDGQTAKQNDGQTANDEQTAKNILQNDLSRAPRLFYRA